MRISSTPTIPGKIDLSSLERLYESNPIERLPFRASIGPNESILIDDKYYTLKSIQNALNLGWITITEFDQETILANEIVTPESVTSNFNLTKVEIINRGDYPQDAFEKFNANMDIIDANLGGGGGSGDVVGPASATDNAIVRFNSTTGKLIQNSSVTIDDSGNIATSGTVDGRDLSVDGGKLDGIEAGAQVNDPTPVASEIIMDRVSGSTYSSVQDAHDILQSVGVISGGQITDDADGTISVSSGNGFIRPTDSEIDSLLFTNWSAESGSNVDLVDNDMNYIYVEYNSGSPRVIATTTKRTDVFTNIFLGSIYRIGTELHITENTRSNIGNATRKVINRLQSTQPFEHESGCILTPSGTLNIAISAGVFWEGITQFTTSAFDSSGVDRFTYAYKDGLGGWTFVPNQSQIDNTQYDDGSGTLATLSNNKYGVHWVYIENDSNIYIIYGEGDYRLSEAQGTSSDGIPDHFLENHTRLIGRIIIEKSASSFTEVLSIFNEIITPTAVDHGDLFGLTHDDHPQYLLADGTRDLTGNLLVDALVTIDGRDLSVDGSKLDGIESGADVTDETNVVSSLSGATLTGVTVATDDKVLVQDTSDSDNLKTVTTQSIADLAPQGTVTSVAVSGSDGIEVDSGSPITSSGTIALGLNKVNTLTFLNVEDGADVTDETNVVSALSGATLTDVGTPASGDRILLQDASDSNNLKYASFSTFGGGSDPYATQRVVNTASPTAILSTDGAILFDTTSTAISIDLPAASVGKITIPFKDIGANAATNNITINAVGSDTIVDIATGQTSVVIVGDGFSACLSSNGVDTWYLTYSDMGGGGLDTAAVQALIDSSAVLRKIQLKTDNTKISGTTQIPADDTIPQITEGVLWMSSDSFTPTASDSILRVSFSAIIRASSASGTAWAIFVDSVSDAIAARPTDTVAGTNYVSIVSAQYIGVAGSTTARTYHLRCGPANAVTVTNYNLTFDDFGGLGTFMQCIIEEYAP